MAAVRNKLKVTPKPCRSCGDPMRGAQLYKKIPTYRVRAKQMSRDFAVKTLEGVMKGHNGDYLCEDTDGNRWPVKKEIFERTFVLADA